MTRTVEKAYYNLQDHIMNGAELEKMSAKTKNFGQGAEYRAMVPTLEAMKKVIS